ncbi:zinc ribbon domain-containing protein [Evansella sp. AB-rgal1]|uniref:zinc ribbon domain-containing protein n=1 Tax=Evansella sp. AB-rgal1 TaxID=3242696 RepID=UPI00359D827A
MANDLQSKIGEGLSKFQGGIEQGKQKLAIAQEVSKLKKTINESSQKKSKALMELGILTYKKMRTGEITDPEFQEIAKNITGLDKNIYASSAKVNELNAKENENGGVICTSCEAVNGPDDKFCGGCGAKLEKVEELVEVAKKDCRECEETIPSSANFCPCCGSKAS